MNLLNRKWLVPIITVIIVIGTDQFAKNQVVSQLSIGESTQPIPAIASVFQITRSSNTGAAFGLLPDAGMLFLVVPVIIVGVLLYMYRDVPDDARIAAIATGMVIGGALSNVLDRVQYGYVVDFIHYQIPNIISNISNIADHGVVFGVILLMGDSWLRERREKPKSSGASAINTTQEEIASSP